MAMDSDLDTMVATDTTARGLLRPSPRPRPRLIPTTMVDTVWAMPDMAMDTVLDIMAVDMAMDLDTMEAMDTTARGLLRPSPRPRLRLIPTTMVDTVWAMPDMAMDTVLDIVMAVDMATTVKPEDSFLVPALHQPRD